MNRITHNKTIAMFFLITFLPSFFPINLLYASNNGPTAPEASSFEPVSATDMVNLSSGDMSYVLPLMDVGGFPVSLSYHGGVPLDLESTWTGLGWNLNTGAINRGLNATPDDWRGGNSLDFIRFEDSETIYTVNVGVGLGKAAEVGVGASWGSNKSLSGSVFASVGIQGVASASGSIDTDGNYSLGIGVSTGDNGKNLESFGGGISMSGNVSGGKTSFGVGAGYRSAGGMTVGLGASLDGGMSVSLGKSNAQGSGKTATGASGSGSLSISNFSSGDWQVSSKGWYIPIQIKFISFGFGKRKVTTSLKKAYKKQGYGILYSSINSLNTANDAIENENGIDTQFYDYQNRYRYSDAYDQALPQTETEFVGDQDAEREKLNFTFAGYDTYDVNATGISGIMTPRVLENATLYGLGYNGSDPNSVEGKQKIFYHNTLTTNKSFGNNTVNDIEFYFNGQFSQTAAIPPLTPISNTNTTFQGIVSTRQVLNNNRLKQGNYVEVFTNKQIKNFQASGLLSPLNPNGNGVALEPLSRNGTEYKDDGIGGYKITAPDGKIYHFSQPVYHFEQVERNILKDTSQDHVSEKRQYTSYATHWLLTAITGPDFIDINGNNIADAADYGYWVRMDYGKWSDGYVWRNPTDKNLKDYNTNLENDIEKKEFGTYQFGRKQLFYLDRIVSATHTAIFVKDLRYDSVGCDLEYSFLANKPNILLTNSGTGIVSGSDPGINVQESIVYKRQLQLMLKKIILVKNSDAIITKGNINDVLKLNYPSENDKIKNYQPGFSSSGGFVENNTTVVINSESAVYDSKDFENFDYNKALKVVDLEYNYNLAVKDHTNNLSSPDPAKSKGSPGTIAGPMNPNAGKLCLKSIRFLGTNNFDYMPPYKFEYKGEYTGSSSPYIKYPANALVQKTNTGFNAFNYSGKNISYAANTPVPIADIRAKDEWGFLKDNPGQDYNVAAAAWTMTKIITPSGSSINFEHEEDDFEQEAFSRRFWVNNLKFKVTDLNLFDIQIEVTNQDGLAAGLKVDDFNQYFKVNERIYFDLWLARAKGGSSATSGALDVSPNGYCKVSEVTATGVKILASKQSIPLGTTQTYNANGDLTYQMNATTPAKFSSERPDYVQGCFFSKATSPCSHLFRAGPRGYIPDVSNCPFGNCPDNYTMTYKLLANKVPNNLQGGGLRVKSITLDDNNNNQYKTNYYYNVPGTGKSKNSGNYKSSGITSYSPVRGTKFVPYQSELPGPGVMYEYVTMVAANKTGETLGETRYRFHVLKPIFDIFNENLVMRDDDGTEIFNAQVTNHTSENGYLNQAKKINAKSIKLGINTSLVGQFRSIEEFNNQGQLLSKVEKKYTSGMALKNEGIRGTLTESFQSMKSVFNTNKDYGSPVLKNRLLSISSKEEFTSVLRSTVKTGMHGVDIETYSQADPITGEFLSVETQKSDGTKMLAKKVPAYVKYPEMGSKITNPNNKNMLSQVAAEYSYILNKATGAWKETGVGLTTWSNIWTYRNIDGSTETPGNSNEKIWRKHKSYIWNGVKDADGIFTNYNSTAGGDDGFNWTIGVGSQPAQWKLTSETTLYNHYSNILEVKDINGNFAATKMGDDETKIMATGNAGYNEMFYSGAENLKLNTSWLEPDVKMNNATRTSDYVHTGKYSIAATLNSEFGVLLKNTEHKAGKYKLSVWVEKANSTKATLKINGAIVPFVNDNIVAGNWVLKTAIVIVPSTDCAIYLNSSDTTTVYYDDFMLRPIASSVTGYVYNSKDELTHIIGNNGLATKFEYDAAGRLIKTYVEVIDDALNQIEGGFKLTTQSKINYRNLN